MKIRYGLLLLVLLAAGDTHGDCTTCHAQSVQQLGKTPHRVLQPAGDPSAACTQCHGSAAAHMQNPFGGGVHTFDAEPASERSEACGSCHADAHSSGRTAHAQAGVACNDCHRVHAASGKELKVDEAFAHLPQGTAVCAGCHDDVIAQFAQNNRHKLDGGTVTCLSCHDPHAEPAQTAFGADRSEACEDCHASTAGPFVFEHAASRVDGCLACHAPHGSANRHLLNHQQTGELCYSCHANAPQFHLGFAPNAPVRFGIDSVCTNCHVTIHGSNIDPAFLK